MAAKSTKTKSKRRPALKPKRAGNKPLLAASAMVRRAKRASRPRAAIAAASPPVGYAAFPMLELIGRMVRAYAELPGRLVRCRTPMDVWLEQARFAQRIFTPDRRT
jgi:hypothetical protein